MIWYPDFSIFYFLKEVKTVTYQSVIAYLGKKLRLLVVTFSHGIGWLTQFLYLCDTKNLAIEPTSCSDWPEGKQCLNFSLKLSFLFITQLFLAFFRVYDQVQHDEFLPGEDAHKCVILIYKQLQQVF